MDHHDVCVRPAAGGWRLDSPVAEPLMFLSGAKAEAKAHALAQGIARAGKNARVIVQDRAERIVGTARYLARA